ncbi:MAG: DUF4433 domain-containing protein [Ruminococcus sp.]|nr:DUF4433 domain-containing protein [Ruminococcus sp.]
MKKIEDGKLLYHLTTLDVFESIVIHGLMSRNELNARHLDFVDTANHDILSGRERLNLSHYVPFHFHIHTAYDTAVKNTYTDKEFIYLCLTREYARSHDFLILPTHPTSTELPELYSYDEGFLNINWNIMNLKKNDEFPDDVTERKRTLVRMAECLSPNPIPIGDFQSISVKNVDLMDKVIKILRRHKVAHPPYVDIKPNYF